MDKLYWHPVKKFEGLYEINEQGQIRSLHARNIHKILRPRLAPNGYYTISLYKNKKPYTLYLHRLLADTFINNPESKCCVNHKNGNKLDNTIGNLEFVSHSENILHAYKNGLIKTNGNFQRKKVIDRCSNTIYRSMAEAYKQTTYSYAHFKRMLHGTSTNYTCFKLIA